MAYDQLHVLREDNKEFKIVLKSKDITCLSQDRQNTLMEQRTSYAPEVGDENMTVTIDCEEMNKSDESDENGGEQAENTTATTAPKKKKRRKSKAS